MIHETVSTFLYNHLDWQEGTVDISDIMHSKNDTANNNSATPLYTVV